MLTIGEVERGAPLAGMITLIPEDNRVQFEVNIGAAERIRLKISSKALRLAKRVRGREKS
jgi:YfiR/HmsC-like